MKRDQCLEATAQKYSQYTLEIILSQNRNCLAVPSRTPDDTGMFKTSADEKGPLLFAKYKIIVILILKQSPHSDVSITRKAVNLTVK